MKILEQDLNNLTIDQLVLIGNKLIDKIQSGDTNPTSQKKLEMIRSILNKKRKNENITEAIITFRKDNVSSYNPGKRIASNRGRAIRKTSNGYTVYSDNETFFVNKKDILQRKFDESKMYLTDLLDLLE